MNIQNNTVITKKELKQFAFENLKRNTVKPLIFLVVALGLLSALLISEGKYMETLLWICGSLGFILLVFVITYFVGSNQSKSSKISQGSTYNTYVFLEDEIQVSTKNDLMNSNVVIKNESIYRITENKDILYIWLDKNQAYIVSKKGFLNDDLEIVIKMLEPYKKILKKKK